MSCALNRFLFVFIIALTASCGAKVNPSGNNIFTSTLLERQCIKNTTVQEDVTVELAGLYNDFLKKNALPYFNIPERLYDYKSPLVINLSDLRSKINEIKSQMADEVYLQDHYTEIAHNVYFLYQSALRYEGSKCQLKYLSSKKSLDIAPYLSMKDFCIDKMNIEVCGTFSLLDLTTDESLFVKENTVQMCGLLTGNSDLCGKQYSKEIVAETQNRFYNERYSKLFTLKSSHLNFNCEKNLEVTTMNIKIFRSNWDIDKLKALIDYVAQAWTRNNFILSFDIVETRQANVIEVIPTNKPVSFVMNNDNHQIYLSQLLDTMTQKKVMAHEFGHVLGFPDCYTEFYDRDKKSLIYYEISKDNTNIMCSMKNGVSVPDDYLEQLAQKSCLFN